MKINLFVALLVQIIHHLGHPFAAYFPENSRSYFQVKQTTSILKYSDGITYK
jgi:hypothetical protein